MRLCDDISTFVAGCKMCARYFRIFLERVPEQEIDISMIFYRVLEYEIDIFRIF